MKNKTRYDQINGYLVQGKESKDREKGLTFRSREENVGSPKKVAGEE